MLIHKPWSVLQTIISIPGMALVAVGMVGLTMYAGLMWIKDLVVPREGISDHDRFADRAVYSSRKSIDPLAR
jgi:hypothetical protein